MLIPLPDVLKAYGKQPTAAWHLGAHLAQEAPFYRAAGISDVTWIEANPDLMPRLTANLRRYPGHKVVNACLGPVTGETVTFHISEADNLSNQGQSSSMLALGSHLVAHPEVAYIRDLTLTTMTLDDIIGPVPDSYDRRVLLSLDLQGAELLALAGAEETVKHVDLIITECNVDSLYVDCALLPAYDEWMVAHGFEIQQVKLAGCQRRGCEDGGNRWVGWGDMTSWRVENPRPFAETHPEDAADWYR